MNMKVTFNLVNEKSNELSFMKIVIFDNVNK